MWREIKPNYSNVKEGKNYNTCIIENDIIRNEQIMRRQGNMWFAGKEYVYYRPTHIEEIK